MKQFTFSKENKISVFFPCYNDSKSIKKMVEDAFLTLKKISSDFEVIVIDDKSEDNSKEVLLKLTKKYPKLKLIFHEKNQGYGGALKSGFKTASKDLIFYTDGDGQYDVKELPILLMLMTENIDFVNGIKMTRHDYTYRIIIGNFYSFVMRWIFLLPIYDVDCDFRLIRKDLIQKINLESNSGSICVELVKKSKKIGAKFRQVSVHHYERKFGQSQFFRPSRIFSTLLELSHLWFKLIVIKKILPALYKQSK